MNATKIRRALLHIAVSFALALPLALLPRPALAALDYTDIWWSAAESGWGVNFVQADNFIFATFFVYGANDKPIWYTGQLTRDAKGIWIGPLYVTTGTYLGAPWNPATQSATQVGTATFSPASQGSGTLTYNVDAVTVTKEITRQTLKTIVLSGLYMGGLVATYYGCTNSADNGSFRRFADVNVAQNASGQVQIDLLIQGESNACSLAGTLTQTGQLYRVSNATYNCGGTGPATVYELKATAQGIEGRWQVPSTLGCTESGVFSAVFK